MNNKLTTIDPNQGNIPDAAIIQKVISENDRLPNGEHEKAVKAFYFSDSIASGIGKDFAFVEKIPQLISDIIDNKSWECLYVSRGVVTPYYCRYTKGTDSENFRAFIAAKRPNGLETTIETIDRLLEADLEVRNKFRFIVYESRQGERTDLDNDTCYSHYNKSEDSIGKIQKARIRAANRAAEAIPEIRELLDRGLIAIDVAAKLGRDIKDPDNLTSEEREYVDKRDLVGLRIKEYINTNTIPEDEDKEPAYSRKLNEFVKDLLGIKNRSKAVRMDNPKKAAEKLLKFYEGQKLQELLKYLQEGLKTTTISDVECTSPQAPKFDSGEQADSIQDVSQKDYSKRNETQKNTSQKLTVKDLNVNNINGLDSATKNNKKENYSKGQVNSQASDQKEQTESNLSNITATSDKNQSDSNLKLTRSQLGKRLGLNPKSISNFLYKQPNDFSQWTRKKDPEGIAWQKDSKKEGRTYFFIPVQKIGEE
ncbi:MAG: hypothetical protein AB4206_17220 [Xenococcaceae cyanobacterium]